MKKFTDKILHPLHHHKNEEELQLEREAAPTISTTSSGAHVISAPVPCTVEGHISHNTSHVSAATTETIVKPALVDVTTRQERVVEVQPVIHREVDTSEIHHVEKHSYEKVASHLAATHTNQPIVEETVKPHIINEVQPIVHREVPVINVEHVEQHITERVVEPAIHTKQVIVDNKPHIVTEPVLVTEKHIFQEPRVVTEPYHFREQYVTQEHHHHQEPFVARTVKPPHIVEERQYVAETARPTYVEEETRQYLDETLEPRQFVAQTTQEPLLVKDTERPLLVKDAAQDTLFNKDTEVRHGVEAGGAPSKLTEKVPHLSR